MPEYTEKVDRGVEPIKGDKMSPYDKAVELERYIQLFRTSLTVEHSAGADWVGTRPIKEQLQEIDSDLEHVGMLQRKYYRGAHGGYTADDAEALKRLLRKYRTLDEIGPQFRALDDIVRKV